MTQNISIFPSLEIGYVRIWHANVPMLATRYVVRVNPSDRSLETSAFIQSLLNVEYTVIEKIGISNAAITHAWESLNHCVLHSAHTLANILVILLETAISNEAYDRPFQSLPIPTPSTKPKATAAHPRAYRGTQYKPPKSKSPDPIDVRIFLFNDSSIRQILDILFPYFEEACAELTAQGYKRDRLLNLYTISSGWRDVNLAYYHPDAPKDLTCAKLPVFFVHDLLPCLRNKSWNDIGIHLQAYWTLQLESDHKIRAITVALLRLASSSIEIRIFEFWYRIWEQVPEVLRSIFATLTLESLAILRNLSPSILEKMEHAFHVFHQFYSDLDLGNYAHRAYAMLEPLSQGIDTSDRLDGFALSDLYQYTIDFIHLGDADSLSYQEAEYYGQALSNSLSMPVLLWERCHKYPGMAQLIRTTQWEQLTPKVADSLLSFWMHSLDNWFCGKEYNEKWNWFYNEMQTFRTWLYSIPKDYQFKAIDMVKDAWYTWASVSELYDYSPILYSITTRLCTQPFAYNNSITLVAWISEALCKSTKNDPVTTLFDRWLNMPDSSFLAFEDALRSETQAYFIVIGLSQLITWNGEYALRLFEQHPMPLFETARCIGSLQWGGAWQFLEEAKIHSFWQYFEQNSNKDLKKICSMIDEWVRPTGFNPISRQLRKHIHGTSTLRPTQIKRHLQKLESNIDLILLKFLQEFVFRKLWNDFHHSKDISLVASSKDKWLHALQISHFADENRRALRKALQAWLRGKRHYVEHHHETQKWQRKHLRLSEKFWACWRIGLKLERACAPWGQIYIEIETDILEILKMGTYVGSCVGLGGHFEHNAAAAVLDWNKKVIYARDSQGQVLARQVIALSEEENLVCFRIYPWSTSPELRLIFVEFVQEFSKKLELPLYDYKHQDQEDDSDYVIANILSKCWYDDGAWLPDEDKP